MRSFVALFLVPLAACATVSAEQPIAVAGAGECRNEGLDRFTGQAGSAEVGSALLSASGAKRLQWIQPGMMVTMDFRSDRLRVRLDAANRILSARCG